MMDYETRYIILKKVPFQEHSLIVSGISPEFGRLDFLWKGARNTGRKKFPAVALFREFQIFFRESTRSEGLQHLTASEFAASHDGVAAHTGCYLTACSYAGFLLHHCKSMLEIPLTYAALIQMLVRMEKTASAEPWHSLAKLAYLFENGYVPESGEEENADSPGARRKRILHRLLKYSVDSDWLPETAATRNTSEKYWRNFCIWVENLSLYHSLEK